MDFNIFVSNLERLISERNLEMTQLAKDIKVSRNTVYRLTSNPKSVKLENILKLCDYFKVSPNMLIGYELEKIDFIDEFKKISTEINEMKKMIQPGTLIKTTSKKKISEETEVLL